MGAHSSRSNFCQAERSRLLSPKRGWHQADTCTPSAEQLLLSRHRLPAAPTERGRAERGTTGTRALPARPTRHGDPTVSQRWRKQTSFPGLEQLWWRRAGVRGSATAARFPSLKQGYKCSSNGTKSSSLGGGGSLGPRSIPALPKPPAAPAPAVPDRGQQTGQVVFTKRFQFTSVSWQ